MDKNFSAFGLTLEQTQVLFGLEYQLISDDIAFTTNKKGLIINVMAMKKSILHGNI